MNEWYKEILDRKILANEIANAIQKKQSQNTEPVYECEYCNKQYLNSTTQCTTCGGQVKIKRVENIATYNYTSPPKKETTPFQAFLSVLFVVVLAVILYLVL